MHCPATILPRRRAEPSANLLRVLPALLLLLPGAVAGVRILTDVVA